MPNQQSFSMPGPQFGKITRRNWWQRHYQKIIMAVAIVLIAVGAIYFYRDFKHRQTMLQPAIQDLKQLATSTPAIKPTTTTASPAASVSTIARQGSDIVVTVAKGNGRTHVARAALKEYLKDKPELKNNLRPEHLIYLEDWIQKQVKPAQALHPGDTITFSESTFLHALESAQSLTDAQLKNLSKYVPLVPSLMTP